MDARRWHRYAATMPSRATTVSELVAMLESRMAAEPGRAGWILASDGDNTLWRGDVGEALFEQALADRVLRSEALDALLAEAARHGIEVPPQNVNDVASALNDAFLAGRYPNRNAFAMMTWCFAGWRVEELSRYADDVLEGFGFADACRPELEPLLSWCERRSLPLWLVSASPAAVATAAATRMGVAADRVVAMAPKVVGGVIQAELEGEPTYAEGKLSRLRELTDAPLLAALGDSYYDLALLDEAAIAVAVAPGETLRRRIEEMDRLVVILDVDGGGS